MDFVECRLSKIIASDWHGIRNLMRSDEGNLLRRVALV